MMSRILYADDDPDLRVVVADGLSMEGYDVHTAADGVEAMEAMAQTAFDLVLLDIKMPRMDGLAVLREMRRRGLRTRVVMVTGVDDYAVAIEATKLGATDYVAKPYDMDKVVASIRRALQT